METERITFQRESASIKDSAYKSTQCLYVIGQNLDTWPHQVARNHENYVPIGVFSKVQALLLTSTKGD